MIVGAGTGPRSSSRSVPAVGAERNRLPGRPACARARRRRPSRRRRSRDEAYAELPGRTRCRYRAGLAARVASARVWLAEIADSFFRPAVNDLVPYEPGKPVEEVQRELGLERVVKLASNEGPYGPVPSGARGDRTRDRRS